MQAIILASGASARLKPLTDEQHKCLIEINGVTILARILDSLLENNVKDVIITTGPHEEKIKQFVSDNYPAIKAIYIKNDRYNETNYIYSLWLTKDFVNSDIILLHGDLVYDPSLKSNVIKSNKSCVLIERGESQILGKDFKARFKQGVVKEIGVNVSGDNVKNLMPLYKFLHSDWKRFMEEMDRFVRAGKLNVYAENAFNAISDKIILQPIFYDNGQAMEIDDFDDLEKARKLFV